MDTASSDTAMPLHVVQGQAKPLYRGSHCEQFDMSYSSAFQMTADVYKHTSSCVQKVLVLRLVLHSKKHSEAVSRVW